MHTQAHTHLCKTFVTDSVPSLCICMPTIVRPRTSTIHLVGPITSTKHLLNIFVHIILSYINIELMISAWYRCTDHDNSPILVFLLSTCTHPTTLALYSNFQWLPTIRAQVVQWYVCKWQVHVNVHTHATRCDYAHAGNHCKCAYLSFEKLDCVIAIGIYPFHKT